MARACSKLGQQHYAYADLASSVTRGAFFPARAVEAKLRIDMRESSEVRLNFFHAVWQRGVMQRIAGSVQGTVYLTNESGGRLVP